MTNQNVLRKIIFILFVSILVGCGTQPTDQPVTQPTAQPVVNEQTNQTLPRDIDVATVEELRNHDDVVVLDVREDWEYETGHIPETTWIPLGELPARLTELPKDKTVVVVCHSGGRSDQATEILRQQGFDNAHNMLGGMVAWSQAGYEVVSGR
jgi:rhodanese-related sulfurtransferase